MPIINQVVQGGGTTPTGTKSITTNGTYDVTDYASADVQVATTAPEFYRVFRNDSGKLKNSITTPMFSFPNSITEISHGCFAFAYYSVGASTPAPITGTVDMSHIERINGEYACYQMFRSCTGITGVDLSSLQFIGDKASCEGMFMSCSNLTTVDVSSLRQISGTESVKSMFVATGIVSIDFASLEQISSNSNQCMVNVFQGCNNLTTAKFNKLKETTVWSGNLSSYAAFDSCPKLENVYFGGFKASTFSSVKNQIRYIFSSNTGSAAPNGCTIHFPSNFDPTDPNHTFDASTLTGYPTFGGNANYIHVAFDLPATE